MFESGIVDTVASSLIGGGAGIGVSILLLRKAVSELDERLCSLERERKDCQKNCEDKINDGSKTVNALQISVLNAIGDLKIGMERGMNDVKIQIAKLESREDLASEIAKVVSKVK